MVPMTEMCLLFLAGGFWMIVATDPIINSPVGKVSQAVRARTQKSKNMLSFSSLDTSILKLCA